MPPPSCQAAAPTPGTHRWPDARVGAPVRGHVIWPTPFNVSVSRDTEVPHSHKLGNPLLVLRGDSGRTFLASMGRPIRPSRAKGTSK